MWNVIYLKTQQEKKNSIESFGLINYLTDNQSKQTKTKTFIVPSSALPSTSSLINLGDHKQYLKTLFPWLSDERKLMTSSLTLNTPREMFKVWYWTPNCSSNLSSNLSSSFASLVISIGSNWDRICDTCCQPSLSIRS